MLVPDPTVFPLFMENFFFGQILFMLVEDSLFSKQLTLYQNIQYVNDSKEKGFWKHSLKTKGKMLVTDICSSIGHRPASLCHGLLSSCVPLSVCVLTFSLNIFSETTYRILMKFHRTVHAMVLFRISWNNLIPSKTGCHGNKTQFFLKSLKIFLSETIRPRAIKFGM